MIRSDIARAYQADLMGGDSIFTQALADDGHPLNEAARAVNDGLNWFAYLHPQRNGAPQPLGELSGEAASTARKAVKALYPSRADFDREHGGRLPWDQVLTPEEQRGTAKLRQNFLERYDPLYSAALREQDHPDRPAVMKHRDAWYEWMYGADGSGQAGPAPQWRVPAEIDDLNGGPKPGPASSNTKRDAVAPAPGNVDNAAGPITDSERTRLAAQFQDNVLRLLGLDREIGAKADANGNIHLARFPNDYKFGQPVAPFGGQKWEGGGFFGRGSGSGLYAPRAKPSSPPTIAPPPVRPSSPSANRLAPGNPASSSLWYFSQPGSSSGSDAPNPAADPYPYPEDDRDQGGKHYVVPNYSPFPENEDQERGGSFTLPPIVLPDHSDLPRDPALPPPPRRLDEVIPSLYDAIFRPFETMQQWGGKGSPATQKGTEILAEQCRDILTKEYPDIEFIKILYEKYVNPRDPSGKLIEGTTRGSSRADAALQLRRPDGKDRFVYLNTDSIRADGNQTLDQLQRYQRLEHNGRYFHKSLVGWFRKLDLSQMTVAEYTQLARARCKELMREFFGPPQKPAAKKDPAQDDPKDGKIKQPGKPAAK